MRMSPIRCGTLFITHRQLAYMASLSSISTARLNSNGLSLCLSPPSNTILIPVLLNNTTPSHIRYSITVPGSDKPELFDLNTKDLKAIEHSRAESLHLTKSMPSSNMDEEDEDDWDAEDEDDGPSSGKLLGLHSTSQSLEKTQSIAHLRMSKPGIIRLEQVVDAASSNSARIYPTEFALVPCPQAEFVEDRISRGDSVRCVGSKEELTVKIFGVPPLTLKWHREINGRREHFSIEKIEGSPEVRSHTFFFCLTEFSNILAGARDCSRTICSSRHAVKHPRKSPIRIGLST